MRTFYEFCSFGSTVAIVLTAHNYIFSKFDKSRVIPISEMFDTLTDTLYLICLRSLILTRSLFHRLNEADFKSGWGL